TPSGSNYTQTIQLNGAASSSVVIGPPSATVTIPTITEPITVTDTPGVFNTSSGANVTVTPVDTTTGTTPVTLTFANLTQPGVTSLTTSPSGPSAPSGFQLGNPGVYYNISTTATYTGSVMICISYTGITFTQPPQLFHYQSGAWVNVTTSVNSTTMIVCGTTTSFSPFALFQPSAFPTTTAISAAGVSYGTPGSVTVSVSSAGGTVTGNVSLTMNGGTASTMALSNGSAVFNLGVLNAVTHTLSASFAAQGNFLASSAVGTISVAQAPLKVSANNATRVYGGANPTLTANYAGFVNGDTSSVLIGTLSCATTATSTSPVGTYPIVCSGQSAANYSITYLPGQLTVGKATLTITANNLTKNFDALNPTLTWTANGFLNGDSTSVFTTLPTCTTTAITTSPVGSYPIACSGAAAANYTFSYVAGSLTVTCHYVSIGLSPSTVAEGGLITVSWTLRSCANSTQTVAFTFTLSGPAQPDSCSPTKTEMFSLPPFALKPSTLQSLSFPFKIPKGICAGTYSTAATATINGQVVDTSSTSLTITVH
ncbi:MAG: MBG domain-containing protein, partial [Candidatus Acidiferrum sp.]